MPSPLFERLIATVTIVTPVTIVTTLALGACASTPAQRTNFDRCLADDYTCNSALLTDEETLRLNEARAPRHFEDCLAGRRCDEAALGQAEREQVRRSVALLNFQTCLRGEAACRPQMLTGAQRREAGQAAGVRNFSFCLSGLSTCDASVLTQSQRDAVREAYLQRNFAGCMNSVGTLLGCNSEDLSGEQQAMVNKRNLAVNLYMCTHALMGCNAALLTEDQRRAAKR